jgi:hypothetical protein
MWGTVKSFTWSSREINPAFIRDTFNRRFTSLLWCHKNYNESVEKIQSIFFIQIQSKFLTKTASENKCLSPHIMEKDKKM